MKERLTTGAIGIAILLLVFVFYKTPVLNASVALVGILAVHEIFTVTHNLQNRGLYGICLVFAATLPFLHYVSDHRVGGVYAFCFLTAVFVYLLARHGKFPMEQAALCFTLTLLTSYALSCIAWLRDIYTGGAALRDEALFYLVLVFAGAWVTDAGAWLFGITMGKHKLSPNISPKKTVEGAVGGILATVVFFAAAGFVYQAYLHAGGSAARVEFPALGALALLCAVFSMLGDLSASVLKRQHGYKDFGNLLPGHGGILDRFDSLLFVAPLLLFYLGFFRVVGL